ncbi:MAG: DeoR family transcriptional regulator, partial [Bradyrhizobium sp.]
VMVEELARRFEVSAQTIRKDLNDLCERRSLPGVGAGVLLCFIPIVGEFVIPDLLAGSNSLMIGQTLWLEFFTNKDWPVASAAAIVLLAVLLVPLLLYERLQKRQLEQGR